MKYLKQKTLDRKTLLKGAGVSLGLPLLEAMAGKAEEQNKRVFFIYSPNGYYQENFVPKETGENYKLSKTLEVLKSVKEDVLLLSGLDRKRALGTGVHAQAACTWLTSSPPDQALDNGFPTHRTIDQFIAEKIGRDTMLPSLALSTNDHKDNRETKYFETVSWNAPGYSINPDKNPKVVYQRLFYPTKDVKAQMSLLDAVYKSAKSLFPALGKQDQNKIEEYLESVRGTEKRIQIAEAVSKKYKNIPLQKPESIPEKRADYLDLMADLTLLSFQQDRTRVATLLLDPERWDVPRMYHGVFDKPQNHHGLTHTKGEEAKAKLTKIDQFHISFYARVVEKLKATKDGNSNLLNNTLAIMGSGMSDGASHNYGGLQVLMSGCPKQIKRNEFMQFKRTPLANLWLSLAKFYGVNLDTYADSTGELKDIFV